MRGILVHIGFGNQVPAGRIIAIATTVSAPVRRSIQEARDSGRAIDLTHGHKTKSAIFTDTNQVILSALETTTIRGRIESGGEGVKNEV